MSVTKTVEGSLCAARLQPECIVEYHADEQEDLQAMSFDNRAPDPYHIR